MNVNFLFRQEETLRSSFVVPYEAVETMDESVCINKSKLMKLWIELRARMSGRRSGMCGRVRPHLPHIHIHLSQTFTFPTPCLLELPASWTNCRPSSRAVNVQSPEKRIFLSIRRLDHCSRIVTLLTRLSRTFAPFEIMTSLVHSACTNAVKEPGMSMLVACRKTWITEHHQRASSRRHGTKPRLVSKRLVALMLSGLSCASRRQNWHANPSFHAR